MANSKQPTATVFARSQESWADFVLGKVQAKIADREAGLIENGWTEEEFPNDEILMDLYEDEIFYERYGDEMAKQREYLRKKYFGGD